MTVPLAPAWTTFVTGKCRYRPSIPATLNGVRYAANGWDVPYYWPGSGSTVFDMGSDAPTHGVLSPKTAGFFTVADAAAGATFPIGTTVYLKLVFRRSTSGKETAPEEEWGDADGFVRTAYVVHVMGATRDITVTWTAANVPAEFDKVAVYRALLTEDVFYLDGEANASAGTYTLSKADAALALERPYVHRYGVSKPGRLDGLIAHQSRIWGWDPVLPRAYYFQQSIPGSDRVDDDLPPENILDVCPEDANGKIRAATVRYGELQFYKWRGCYEVTAPSPLNPIPRVRRLFLSRGAMNHRCIVPVDGRDIVLDPQGVYSSVPNSEPVAAGAVALGNRSAFQPYFDRMNLSAWRMFCGAYDRANAVVLFAVALDYDPVPRHVVVYDPYDDRFVSIDTARKILALGDLVDALGTEHLCFGDDTGWPWEMNYNESEGVHAGSVSGTLTGATTDRLTAGAAAFGTVDGTGVVGAPFRRYTSAGVLIETNWVYAAAATTLDPLYYHATAGAAGQTVKVGVIPAVGQLPRFSWESPLDKEVRELHVYADQETGGTLTVQTATNDGSFATKRTITLSGGVQYVVPCNDKGRTWSCKWSQDDAQAGFSLRGLHIRSRSYEGART